MLSRRNRSGEGKNNLQAIAIDLIIVVLGVFIGFQLNNWNTNRAAYQDYSLALDRYVVEANSNLEVLGRTKVEFEAFFGVVPEALDALRSCEDTQENLKTVNVGLNRLGGTFGINLQIEALEELRLSPELLAQQTADSRKVLSEASFKMNFLLKEAKFIEELPLRHRIEANSILDVGPLNERKITYNGIDFSRQSRALLLNVPISQACKNDTLLKSFYTWEKWQSVIPVLIGQMEAELKTSLEKLE